ncbi:MAG: FIG00684176: hypothetical protein, partial [uncultured Solirubrobacteraceae bacterium]
GRDPATPSGGPGESRRDRRWHGRPSHEEGAPGVVRFRPRSRARRPRRDLPPRLPEGGRRGRPGARVARSGGGRRTGGVPLLRPFFGPGRGGARLALRRRRPHCAERDPVRAPSRHARRGIRRGQRRRGLRRRRDRRHSRGAQPRARGARAAAPQAGRGARAAPQRPQLRRRRRGARLIPWQRRHHRAARRIRFAQGAESSCVIRL